MNWPDFWISDTLLIKSELLSIKKIVNLVKHFIRTFLTFALKQLDFVNNLSV